MEGKGLPCTMNQCEGSSEYAWNIACVVANMKVCAWGGQAGMKRWARVKMISCARVRQYEPQGMR